METHPQWINDGYILGRYPKQTVPKNVQLRVNIGFLYGAVGTDGATFQVLFMDEKENMYSILNYKATYDSQLNLIIKDLAFLAGKTGYFILRVDAGKSSGQDWAVWAEARIETTILQDTTPPKVSIIHSPSTVTNNSIVTFTAFATDDTEVTRIVIYVNESVLKECISPEFNKEKNEWICKCSSGPYPKGTLTYRAEAFDSAGNKGVSKTIKLTILESFIPRETRKGWLRVTTEPVQGSIYLNGTYIGLAPLQIELEAGVYTVSFGDVGGYTKPQPQTVMVSAGRVTDVKGTYIKIISPPPVLRKCFISGKIYAFPYNSNTLKVKISEAERICMRPHPLEPEKCFYSYKRDGRVWYADVSVHMIGFAGARIYEYVTEADCNGTYLVEPVYQPYEYECEWRGIWIPSNAIFVEMNGTSKEVNFTFEPLDQNPPNVRIEFSNDQPEKGEAVEIRIIAEDDKGIKSIFIKIGKSYPDDSSIAGNWRRLDFTQNIEGGIYKATARETFREEVVRAIVVNAFTCDEGGNRRFATPRTLEFGCPSITLTFRSEGRIVTSNTHIFGSPDRDMDGIYDCWENAAMKKISPWIEFDEEEDLLDKNPRLRELNGWDYITLSEMERRLINPDRVIIFSRVTSYTSNEGNRYILFYYIVSWSRDYGRFGVEAHNGDTEPVIMAWRVIDDYTIQLECIYVSAHGPCNKRDDIWEPYSPSCNTAWVCSWGKPEEIPIFLEKTCSKPLEFYENRLKLYASEDKHALYPSCQVCESVTVYMPTWERAALEVTASAIGLGGILTGFTLVYLIYDFFVNLINEIKSWWNDDHLQDQLVLLTYADLQRAPDEERQALHFESDSFHYILYWHIENSRFPHVRIVLDSLWCEREDWDGLPRRWGSNEPYLIIVGISLFPETETWVPSPIPPVGDDVDSGEWDEDFPTIVVFDGVVEPYSMVGFSASLFEDDFGETDRVGTAYALADLLRERLSGKARFGECGENVFERIFTVEVGEDCSGGGVYRFPVFNLGEPDHLWINDLSTYGFERESVRGCLSRGGEFMEKFCGGMGCEPDGATSILKMMQIMPDKLKERLR
ncbi:PEGA domain-containing protein [Candidatus Bathyarchaeota archaeon]|nr:PEGA domain-containing protein [Candidatus Bathyarchaeota archaeon]